MRSYINWKFKLAARFVCFMTAVHHVLKYNKERERCVLNLLKGWYGEIPIEYFYELVSWTIF